MNANRSVSCHPAFQELLALVKRRRFSAAQRQEKRTDVRLHVLQNSPHVTTGNFKSLSPADLGLLFHAVDESYFDGLVASVCEIRSDKPLAFRLSSRMTSSGGMTTMHATKGMTAANVDYEIAVATTPLFQTFNFDTAAKVGGLECNDRLSAMQRIMEHELVHLVEMLLWGDSNCAKHPFREIVLRFFGHLETNHQLLTPKDVARKKHGIATGDEVSFESKGQQLVGFVNRISKRATVLVRSESGMRYTDGKRYQKFYVPIHRLRKATRAN